MPLRECNSGRVFCDCSWFSVILNILLPLFSLSNNRTSTHFASEHTNRFYLTHSEINSRHKEYRLESNDTTTGFHCKTVRQQKSSTDNRHVRKQSISQFNLCGNCTLNLDPENAPYVIHTISNARVATNQTHALGSSFSNPNLCTTFFSREYSTNMANIGL